MRFDDDTSDATTPLPLIRHPLETADAAIWDNLGAQRSMAGQLLAGRVEDDLQIPYEHCLAAYRVPFYETGRAYVPRHQSIIPQGNYEKQ